MQFKIQNSKFKKQMQQGISSLKHNASAVHFEFLILNFELFPPLFFPEFLRKDDRRMYRRFRFRSQKHPHLV
jgi:hypothetical protein